MTITINFKHLDHTESLDDKIRSKSERLYKFVEEDSKIEWTCSLNSGEHLADLKIHSDLGAYQGTAKSDNLYKSLDLALSKVEKQLSKTKEKTKNRVHKNAHKKDDIAFHKDAEAVWGEYEE